MKKNFLIAALILGLSACSPPNAPHIQYDAVQLKMNNLDFNKIKKYHVTTVNSFNKKDWWSKSFDLSPFNHLPSEADKLPIYYYLAHADLILLEGSETYIFNIKNELISLGADPKKFVLHTNYTLPTTITFYG